MSDDTQYHRFLIKSLQRGDQWFARALRGRVQGPTEAGATREEAIHAVISRLDAASGVERASRGPDGYPTAAWVLAALEQLNISKDQDAMLAAHLAASDHVLTATELAKSAGYSSYETANSRYGKLARSLAEEMEWEPPREANGKIVWTFALATDADEVARVAAPAAARLSGHWRWRLRPQIADALRALQFGGADAPGQVR